MEQLTTDFTLKELLRSETAVRKGYTEQFQPDETVKANLKLLCENILQPLRDELVKPITINSAYRCARANKAIGGAATSQHQRGQAADIEVSGMTVEEVFDKIIEMKLPFDQLIQEFDAWVHVSYRVDSNNRGQMLRATKENGKTVYKKA